jgi:hypothetical protein
MGDSNDAFERLRDFFLAFFTLNRHHVVDG